MTKVRQNLIIKRLLLLALAMVATLQLPAIHKQRSFEVYNASNGLADNSIHTIHCTRTGRMVISTRNQINFFDGQRFSYIDPVRENHYPLSAYKGHSHLYFDCFHHLWLKNKHLVTCVNLTTEQFIPDVKRVFEEFGIKEKVNDLFVDNDGIVYLLLDKGLYCVKHKQVYPVRKDKNLQDLETDGEKYLLLFYDDGEVDVIEPSTGSLVFSSAAYPKSEAKRFDQSSLVFEDGRRYYQVRNGYKNAVFQVFDLVKWKWTTLMEVPYRLNGIVAQDSVLYLPCQYGYWTYNQATGELEHIEELVMRNGRRLSTNLNVIAFDRQGGMWIGTDRRGLLYSRPFEVPFKVYSWNEPEAEKLTLLMNRQPSLVSFRGKSVNCVYTDSRGWTWVGETSGLNLYKGKEKDPSRVFTLRDGLYNNVIHSVVEDDYHNIWVATSYGISCLKFDETGAVGHVISYNAYDNVPNETFVDGKAIRLDDGTIVMQSLDHVVTFNPRSMATLKAMLDLPMYPKLTSMLVNGDEVRTGEEVDGKVILEKAITRTRELNLDYDKNSISLTFSALNYFRPQQTCYRVRVTGLYDEPRVFTYYNSKGLVDRSGRLHLPMMSMPPGEYHIFVQASMSPDVWNTEPYEWVVNINEPWWRTTGVFVLLGLLVMALVIVYSYFFLRNANLRARLNSEESVIIRRIKAFAEQCSSNSSERLQPLREEVTGQFNPGGGLSNEFVSVMMKIMDDVNSHDEHALSMHSLSKKAGVELQQFYKLMSANIYKSPRSLLKRVMMQRGEEMLRTTDMDVAAIASACRFESPNYFIASFFREHGMLPEEFRKKK